MRLSFAGMFQYRGEIVLWAVWGVVYPAVAMAMWAAAAEGKGGQIQQYGPHEFAAYFLLTMVVSHINTAWDIYQMGWLVQTGRMSPKLLRPILPVWESLTDNIAYKTLTLTILIPIWTFVAWLAQPSFSANAQQLGWGVVAVLLGAVLNFLCNYVLALLAFWVTRMEAMGELWFGAGLFLGGRLAPLEIMPEPIRKVASALPFKWSTWFPAEALRGGLSVEYIQGSLINQLAWIGLMLILFRFIWKAAVRQYSAVGA
jgi:ABC-2 type transport system permease protein